MAKQPGPNVRRRQLARQLRQLREDAGLTLDEAAEASSLSQPTISGIENAQRRILPKNVKLLADAYDVGAPLADHLVRLAKESDERGWWVAYSDTVPDWFDKYVGLESEASLIQSYEAHYIPGLLQTESYVRAISIAGRPECTEDELARSVRLRQARQQRLDESDPPDLALVIDEAVMHRVVGSPDVMREQVEHLVKMAQRPNITLQVLPFSAGAHPGMNGSFIMLSFPDDGAGHTVYLEIEGGALYPDKPRHLDRYKWIYANLQDAALSPDQTTALLSRVAGQY